MSYEPFPTEERMPLSPIRVVRRLLRWALGALVYAALSIPPILLLGIRPWIIALAMAAAALLHIAYKIKRRRQPLARALRGSVYVIGAAILLLLTDSSGILDPMLSKEGHIVPAVQLVADPMVLRPGDRLTFRASSTNPGPGALAGSAVAIDGAPRRGVILYALIPVHEGRRLSLDGTPEGGIWSGGQFEPGQIVYADPLNYTSNPLLWAWRSHYIDGDKIVGFISTGPVERALAVGERIELAFSVAIPGSAGPGGLRQIGAILGYSTPFSAGSRQYFIWESLSTPPKVQMR
ncbi:MAG: hypothetical protein JSW65_02665 [Candidatus Bipolaricaulota bacterium]|nr:MAG: hypothetical protein JSW65_02665 [Candidatus Bipolaricaulota bacterium]